MITKLTKKRIQLWNRAFGIAFFPRSHLIMMLFPLNKTQALTIAVNLEN